MKDTLKLCMLALVFASAENAQGNTLPPAPDYGQRIDNSAVANSLPPAPVYEGKRIANSLPPCPERVHC